MRFLVPISLVLVVASSLVGAHATAQPALSKAKVTFPSLGTRSCDALLSANVTVENKALGSLEAKTVFNGAETPFTLAKGETKLVAAAGGNLSCAGKLEKSIVVRSNVGPVGKGTPLAERTYVPTKVTYAPSGDKKTIAGYSGFIGLVDADQTCGQPVHVDVVNHLVGADGKPVAWTLTLIAGGVDKKMSFPAMTTTPVDLGVLDCTNGVTKITAFGDQLPKWGAVPESVTYP